MLCDIEVLDATWSDSDCPNEAVYLITMGEEDLKIDFVFCCKEHAKSEYKRLSQATDRKVSMYRLQECKRHAIPA